MSEEMKKAMETEEAPEAQEQSEEEPKVLTQADVDRQISKVRERWEAEQAEKIKTAVSDAYAKAQAEAKMTEKERMEADIKSRLEDVEKREKKLADMELLASIKSDLAAQALPLSFAEALLPMQDKKAIQEAIATIKASHDESVQAAVNAKLKQDPPGESTRAYDGKSAFKHDIASFAQENRIIK